jgi:hypothetical protein
VKYFALLSATQEYPAAMAEKARLQRESSMKYRSLTFGLVRRPQMVRPLMRTWKLPVHKELPTHAEYLIAPSIDGLRGIGEI